MVNTGLLGIQICTLKKIPGMDAVVCFCTMSLERPRQNEYVLQTGLYIMRVFQKLRKKACSYFFL